MDTLYYNMNLSWNILFHELEETSHFAIFNTYTLFNYGLPNLWQASGDALYGTHHDLHASYSNMNF